MTCIKHATGCRSSLPIHWGSSQSFKQWDPNYSRGDPRLHPLPYRLDMRRLPVTSSHRLRCFSFCVRCAVSPRVTTDSSSEIRQGCLSSSLRHSPSSGQSQSSHQPSPSTFVIIASINVALQLELITSINCPKGQMQPRPSTSVLSQGQLAQTSTTSPVVAPVKLQCLVFTTIILWDSISPLIMLRLRKHVLFSSEEDKLFTSTGLLSVCKLYTALERASWE